MQAGNGASGGGTGSGGTGVTILPSATLSAAESLRAAKLAELEERRLARTLPAPTDDREVRLALRARGAPVCLFGEDAHDRRARLRIHLARETRLGKPSPEIGTTTAQPEENSTAQKEDEEFYTEGGKELLAFREQLARGSLTRAAVRMSRLKRLQNDASARSAEKDAEERALGKIKSASMAASQRAADRPLSAIALANGLVATGSWAGVVQLWDLNRDCECVQTISVHSARVSKLRFAAWNSVNVKSARILLSAGADSTATMYSRKGDTGDSGVGYSRVAQYSGHEGRVSDVLAHPWKAGVVATAGHDGRVFWHDGTQAILRQETGHSRVQGIDVHIDGALWASCGQEGGVRMWDARSGRAVLTMERAHAQVVTAVRFAPDGLALASAGADNVVRVWDLRTRRCVRTLAAHSGVVSDLRYTGGNSGAYVLLTAGFDGTVKSFATRREFALIKAYTAHDDKVTAIDCSPDAHYVVSACYDKTWKLWGAEESSRDFGEGG